MTSPSPPDAHAPNDLHDGHSGTADASIVDLSNCELEPIRFPAAVQPHGALLVLSPSGDSIEAASESCRDIFGTEATALIGQASSSVFGAEALAALLDTGAMPHAPPVPVRLAGFRVSAIASLNEHGQYLIDIEPETDASDAVAASAQALQRRHDLLELRALTRIDDIAQRAAELVRRWTGFDRVMIYRFDPAWNGEVVAEAQRDGIESYRGLNFPASDIPQMARDLFKLSRVRLIPDVGYVPSALIAKGDTRAIDLGKSALRSVSPIHIEYLNNIGVRATLVGSLVVEGRLWGLLACHHLTGPMSCPPSNRDAIGWFCEDLAAHLGETFLRTQVARARELTIRRRVLIDDIRQVDLRTLIKNEATSDLLDVVAADGFAMTAGNDIHVTGATPTLARIRRLLEQRRRFGQDPTFYATQAMADDLHVEDADDGIAGVLFVSLSYKPDTILIWFRRERRSSIRWAGDPSHSHTVAADGRVSPRKSFALFLSNIRGQAIPWSDEERASAKDLGSLIEIEALRQSEAFLGTVLNSNPDRICVLDRQGVIVAINAAWRSFGIGPGGMVSGEGISAGGVNGRDDPARNPIGTPYRQICSATEGDSFADTSPAWRGIQAVNDGEKDHFIFDYSCHSSSERRWYQMSVYPMLAPCEGVVVTHENVTWRRLTELALSASEQRYLGLLEDQTEVICRFKADGTILYVNDAFVRLFGTQRERLVGNHWQPKSLPDDLRLATTAPHGLSVRRPIVTTESRVATVGNEAHWMQFINRGFFDDSGQLVEIQAVGRDITERRHAELALRSSQGLLERTGALAGVGGWELDLSTRELLWTAETCRLHGMPADFKPDVTRALDFYLPDDRPTIQAAVEAVLAGGPAYDLELQLRRADGKGIWVRTVCTVERAEGKSAKLVGAIQDITAKVEQLKRIEHLYGIAEAQRHELEGYRDRAEDEAEVASFLLSRLSRIEQLDSAGVQYCWQPAESFSGDIIAVARSSSGDTYGMLADATGHGLAAAINLIPLTSAFYAMAAKGFNLMSICQELNKVVKEYSLADRFVAITLARFLHREHLLEVVNAGNPAALLLDARLNTQREFRSGSIPIGIVSQSAFRPSLETVELQGDETLLMFSDGLIEANNFDGQPFGRTGLDQAVTAAHNPGELVASIQGALAVHVAGLPFADDVSLLVLSAEDSDIGAASGTRSDEESDSLHGRRLAPSHDSVGAVQGRWSLNLRFSERELKVIEVVPLVVNLARNFGLRGPVESVVFAVVSELFQNALEHGLLRLDSSIKAEPDGFELYLDLRESRLAGLGHGEILVTMEHAASGPETGELKIIVQDTGPGFDHQAQLRNLESTLARGASAQPSGRGIAMLQKLCRSVSFNRQGNEVEVELVY